MIRLLGLKNDVLSEGKFKAKGKYLYMPDGEVTSMPKASERDRVIVQIKYDKFQIYMNQDNRSFSAYGRYSRQFKNLNDLANWLNKENAKYIGID